MYASPTFTTRWHLATGQHTIADINELFAAFPPINPKRQALNGALAHCVHVVRQFALGISLIIDGSYLSGKAEPEDIDIALLSTGANETATLQRLQDEGVDLNLLDIYVETTQQGLASWVTFFGIDRLGQPRGVILATI